MDETWQKDPLLDSPDGSLGRELTPERWQLIKKLFNEALERNPNERHLFLRDACGDDETLHSEVKSLLAEQSTVGPDSPSAPPILPRAEPEIEDPMVGRRLGAYKILQRIAAGGMGTVYLGERADTEFRKKVAIKVMAMGPDSPGIMRRFRNERQTLAGLDHPNIVKLLDGGTTREGVPYLVMDYVEGVSIDEYCDCHKLPISERLVLFRSVCATVDYAHKKGVIHRDLKPSNIMVTGEGNPKLLDFGIAKILNAEFSADDLLLTAPGERPLTPAYASPEQVRCEPITAASDVYSLGVVLYELLTGHRPYKLKRNSPMELERVICDTDPELPSTAVKQVETLTLPDRSGTLLITPESVSLTREGDPRKLRLRLRGDLDHILLLALPKKPEQRYASAEEFSSDIRRHLEHGPVTARRRTLRYRASKVIRRHRVASTASAAVVLPFAVLGILGVFGTGRLPNPIAAQAVLEGRQHIGNAYEACVFKSGSRIKSEEEFSKGLVALEHATQSYPNYVPAHLALAEAVLGEPPHPDLAPKALAALNTALSLDEANTDAHLLMANYLIQQCGLGGCNPDSPEIHFTRALQLSPDSAETHEAYAEYLDALGRLEGGLKEHEKAQALDPGNDYISNSPLTPLTVRLERTRKFMSTGASDQLTQWMRGDLEYEAGQYDEALKYWAGAARNRGWNEEADAFVQAYSRGGHQAMIQEIVRVLDNIAKDRWFPREMILDAHRYAGDREGTLAWLETAEKERNTDILAGLRSDSHWDAYRSDPRFQRIARNFGIPP